MKKIFILLTFLLFFFYPSTDIYAKDYSIKSVDFEVRINKNGSATVTEKRTYNFDGSFTWADEWIPLKGYTIKNVKLIGADNFTSSIQNDKLYIKWYYSAVNEIKTFTLNYTIENAVTNHNDISEFYWQLIGDEWEKTTENVTAKVMLYEDAKDNKIYGFGHGPLNGIVTIPNTNEVNFSVTNLPPKKMFEVRTLFPKGSLVGGKAGSLNLEDILNEEKEFGLKTKNESILQNIIFLLLSLFVVYRVIVWIKRWIAYGKDDRLPEVNSAGLLHEPPSSISPVLVEILLKGNPTGKSIVSTILELVRRKILSTEFVRNGKKSFFGSSDQYFLVYKENNLKVNEMESDLLSFLFTSTKMRLDFDDIKDLGKKYPSKTSTFWLKWQKDAKDELKKLGFYETESLKYQTKAIVEAVIVGIIAIFGSAAVVLYYYPILIILIIYLMFMIFISVFMPKKSKWGGEEMAGWLAFKKWLKDYSVTKNYPIDSVILWEKYLVYGTALGISVKALSQLPIKFSESFEKSGMYFVGTSNGNFSNSFASISTGFNSLSNSFSGFGAVGTGSSGGFSGGGGGGGGGGG
ncbi:DUF2207 domain-containing protein, partial [Candidatus Dojkabacteria bacterium]|nr:DUF2207 domain-containing protein [Candidatus Dojkabacteria bacterium]